MPVARLLAESDALRQQVAQLSQAIDQLAEPTAHRLVQALASWVRIAQTPGHAGQAQARQLVQSYAAAHRRAMALAGGLVVPGSSDRVGP